MITLSHSGRSVVVADAHADSLLWNRDLNLRSGKGHVDFPRLREAGVDIQCFTIVTRGVPFVGSLPLFGLARGWPRKALWGEWKRALWQLQAMERYANASGGRVTITRTGQELSENLEAGRLSAVLGVEGAHALEGRIDRVATLHGAGVRFMSLTHLANNELGGSCSPYSPEKGLTRLGQEVLEEMVRLGMSVDVAHASPTTLATILSHPRARPFCSHAGIGGAKASWRNLDDGTLKRIADKGGVVGVIFAPVFLGGEEIEDLARHIDHAISCAGEEAVGLGSDFDGFIRLPRGMRDVTGIGLVASALEARGYGDDRIGKVLGGNLRRFFGETLG